MTTIRRGTSGTLIAEFFEFDGGPLVDLTGVTITITPAAGGSPVVGPTSTGVNHPATGVYTYSWAVAATLAVGDYLVTWSGLDAQSDTVTATELVTVTSIDYGTDIGQVRLLIPDVDEAAQLLTDDQIATFLTLEASSVKKAAAAALETIASSEVMVSKVIRTQDLSTDGAKVAAELRARGAELRRQVDLDDAGGFDVVEFVDPWSRRAGELAEREC